MRGIAYSQYRALSGEAPFPFRVGGEGTGRRAGSWLEAVLSWKPSASSKAQCAGQDQRGGDRWSKRHPPRRGLLLPPPSWAAAPSPGQAAQNPPPQPLPLRKGGGLSAAMALAAAGFPLPYGGGGWGGGFLGQAVPVPLALTKARGPRWRNVYQIELRKGEGLGAAMASPCRPVFPLLYEGLAFTRNFPTRVGGGSLARPGVSNPPPQPLPLRKGEGLGAAMALAAAGFPLPYEGRGLGGGVLGQAVPVPLALTKARGPRWRNVYQSELRKGAGLRAAMALFFIRGHPRSSAVSFSYRAPRSLLPAPCSLLPAFFIRGFILPAGPGRRQSKRRQAAAFQNGGRAAVRPYRPPVRRFPCSFADIASSLGC